MSKMKPLDGSDLTLAQVKGLSACFGTPGQAMPIQKQQLTEANLSNDEIDDLVAKGYLEVISSGYLNREYFDPAKKETVDEEWAKRKVCGACVSSICLDATGFYFPCAGFAGVNLGSCYEHDLKWIWTESPETKRIRAVCGKDFPKCLHCPDRDYCSVCMCRNFNETGDIFTPAQHFCDVAKLNHEIVDDAQAKRLAAKKQ